MIKDQWSDLSVKNQKFPPEVQIGEPLNVMTLHPLRIFCHWQYWPPQFEPTIHPTTRPDVDQPPSLIFYLGALCNDMNEPGELGRRLWSKDIISLRDPSRLNVTQKCT